MLLLYSGVLFMLRQHGVGIRDGEGVSDSFTCCREGLNIRPICVVSQVGYPLIRLEAEGGRQLGKHYDD